MSFQYLRLLNARLANSIPASSQFIRASSTSMLDSTKVKIKQCYADAFDYIQSLNNERDRLNTMTSNEDEMNKLESKSEVFQQLNSLLKVSNTFKKIEKATADFNELNEMLTITDDADEFKNVLVNDLKRLETNKLELKTDMLQYLIPEV